MSIVRFDIITIFPKIFDSYLNESMIKRARAKNIVDIHIHDLRKFSCDKHKKVDDRPYGGGPGMVLKVEPIAKALDSLLKVKELKSSKTKIILFSASGKQFNAKTAANFAKKYDRIIMIAGRYEGVDERIFSMPKAKSHKLTALSIGPYVLTGGELPALVAIDAISRHIPGFLGKAESLEEARYGVGVPMYTRPEVFTWKGKKYTIPKVLTTGNHKKIDAWRMAHVRHHKAV